MNILISKYIAIYLRNILLAQPKYQINFLRTKDTIGDGSPNVADVVRFGTGSQMGNFSQPPNKPTTFDVVVLQLCM